jgi:hypothetical protein
MVKPSFDDFRIKKITEKVDEEFSSFNHVDS